MINWSVIYMMIAIVCFLAIVYGVSGIQRLVFESILLLSLILAVWYLYRFIRT